MKPFDLKAAPLEGITLIEAGAGTGKTFTLAGIFLRLIVERGLGIDQILVVTYTKAATEELKTRIRNRLLTARATVGGREPSDEFVAHLISRIEDKALVRQRIEDALTDFDRAAIFTIHGFCQRLLQHFAFETGHRFNSELVQDQQSLVQEVTDDFWRRYIGNAPYELTHYALGTLKGPRKLAEALFSYLRFPTVTLLPKPVKPSLGAIVAWRRAADQMVRLWAQQKEKILNLLSDPGLNARYYGKCEADRLQPAVTQRRLRLLTLAAAMDFWNGKYPLFDKAERFSASFLAKATKKNHVAPQHPFFDVCSSAVAAHAQMIDQMAAYLRYLKIRLCTDARQQLDSRKARLNILFFDDLLLHVHGALEKGLATDLIRLVRGQYKAALVDEFQDTDPLQYAIFARLFSRPTDLLVMIGDPKQAIYSFRGADIFSYLKAAENARTNNTLTKNWRSTPTLVKAVNTIFESHGRPFGFERITFNPASAAKHEPLDESRPLKLWCITGKGQTPDEKPVSRETAVSAIAEAVAEEIVRLISDPALSIKPFQIAILTRTHKQSQIVKKALVHKMVPAVLHSAGSVYDTAEAEAMNRVMAAAAAPHNPLAVRAALASDLFGATSNEFYSGLQNASEQWQTRWSAFFEDHRTWLRYGFYRMFRGLMARENVKARMLKLPDGQRRLTNLLHLAELIQHAETQHRLEPAGLIKWLAVQRQSVEKSSDEQQLRLESDALAVRIITMHKSKGLQFDVVFCPFVWSGTAENDSEAVFHEWDRDYRVTLALGPDIPPEFRLQARKEALAENLRMMYVALTRARRLCYLVWGRISNTEVSAPAYLLHSPESQGGDGDWISPLIHKMRSITDDGLMAELQGLSHRSGGSIVVEPLPKATGKLYAENEKTAQLLECRTIKRTIESDWRIASFSSLTAAAPAGDQEWPDRDLSVTVGLEKESGPEAFNTLFGFPKGAGAGLFFHDLLEHWDQTDPDRERRHSLVTTKLKSHGFDRRWANAVDQMLADLAATCLESADDHFTMAQVPVCQRINEMEFYFPLQTVDAKSLTHIFGQRVGLRFDHLHEQGLERLTFQPLQGYMKGFVDAVFRFAGRYYLVDWKSNHLGDAYTDYDPPALARTMVRDYYFLQYHLYVTALDLMLKQKIKTYDYNRHFGGVFYIFLRGIGPGRTGTTGVFYDLPDARLVEELGARLIKK